MQENIFQNQPTGASAKLTSRWLKIILFSVLGVVLVGGLVFAGIQVRKKQEQTLIQLTPKPSSSIIPTQLTTPILTLKPVSTIVPDQTTDWKTYTNTKYRFSYKYPSYLFYRAESIPEFTVFLDKSNEYKDGYLPDKLSVSVNKNAQDIDLQVFSEQNKPIPDDITSRVYEKLEINGNQALMIRSKQPCIGFPEICEKFNNIDKGYTILIKGEKIVVSFSAANHGPGGVTRADEEWLNLILSTFRFLE